MDYELGEQADRLRLRLRQMVEEHLPEGFLGAFTDDPEDLAITQRFCKLLAAEGLLAKAWPTGYGAAAAPCGNRRWCGRRCGPTTSPGDRSTWASTGWAPRS